jgi:hypothetical protein
MPGSTSIHRLRIGYNSGSVLVDAPLTAAMMPEKHTPDDHVLERLTDFLEGDLNEPDRARVASHLDQCPACRQTLAELKETIRLLGQLPKRLSPPD